MVKVTDADREAAASVAVLPEMRELILAGRADHHAEPFARHRIAGAAALIEAGDRLAGFAGHDGSCASGHAGLDAPYSACDCGYTEAVKAWKEVRQ
jgi:hypothetical protein